jgi:quercetin dioxygenase-like cupin family protein
MEVKFNTATIHRPQGDRILDAPLVAIDVVSIIKQLKKEKKWRRSDRNAITVFKTTGMRIVLIAMNKDTEMVRHTANGKISLQVLKGKLQFRANERSVKLNTGQMLALHEGIPYTVVAKKKVIFLLTLTGRLQKYNQVKSDPLKEPVL